MPARYVCPECGIDYTEPVVCLCCFCETIPDARHPDNTLHSDEVPRHLLGIERTMRMNRGLVET